MSDGSERPCQAKNPALCPHHGLHYAYDEAFTAYQHNPSPDNFTRLIQTRDNLEALRKDPELKRMVMEAAAKYETAPSRQLLDLNDSLVFTEERESFAKWLDALSNPTPDLQELVFSSGKTLHVVRVGSKTVSEGEETIHTFQVPGDETIVFNLVTVCSYTDEGEPYYDVKVLDEEGANPFTKLRVNEPVTITDRSGTEWVFKPGVFNRDGSQMWVSGDEDGMVYWEMIVPAGADPKKAIKQLLNVM